MLVYSKVTIFLSIKLKTSTPLQQDINYQRLLPVLSILMFEIMYAISHMHEPNFL
jgi:hypothetical protein